MSNSDQWISTRFLYKQDTRLCAEIEVIELTPTHYKFVIHPITIGKERPPYMQAGPLDSARLPHPFDDVGSVYEKQLDCLRAATKLLSSLKQTNVTYT